MSLSRRDFMKLVGISVSSLLLTRCNFPIGTTCYAPLPPSPDPADPDSALGRLRQCWLSFGELTQATIQEANLGTADNTFGQGLVADHLAALNELVTSSELTPSVADLIQESYEAAVYHVWRSSAPMTCYEPMMVNYAPVSAGILVQQAAALDALADQGTIDPAILDNARAAIEHDMAFYTLTDTEVTSLYERLTAEWQTQSQTTPAFEDLELKITPDAQAAAQFIISLLTSE